MRSIAKVTTQNTGSNVVFGDAISIEDLTALAAELKLLRDYPPLTQRANGKYEGDILGFVKGLRISARVVYFLRQRLSHLGCEVSWGHLVGPTKLSCSPECDVIIHNGLLHRWNGYDRPVMDFAFVEADKARAVVSCKSQLQSIDKNYPKALKRFGVKNVLLFAESCEEKSFERLRRSAVSAGYRGLWCLYFTRGDGSYLRMDTSLLVDFGNTVVKAVRR